MKKQIMILGMSLIVSGINAQPKDVTKKYFENPDFGARFAAWINPGKMTYNTSSTFEKKSGEIWMEKWVTKGSTLGTNSGMYQTLRNLPTGTYTLVASAKNIQQGDTQKVCTGAYLYAGQEQVEFNAAGDYSVVFTVVNGKADVGVRMTNCNGNWVCVDNFRLYSNGVNADSVATEQARLDAEVAALKEKIASANKTSLKVTTYDFIPTGNTIALGRSTISGSCKEKGYCWSTEGEPTIFDETTTETFDNNGLIYVMRGLTPSTSYYVRPYAMTSGGYIAYGQTKKIVTLPAGNMSYGYFNDNGGDEETCARINSASAECVWMYNNLSYIPGFYLSVHYVPGAGSGGGTADCSYGGWMRVSQSQAYQQTGTMLHETNHGVGVGTTGEWYNNSYLRAETSRGLWLGPMATKMVRFFDNNAESTMTGDGTHMWPYGINGAHEDSYQPSNQCLYYANILITHAMHQDGLPCTSGVGFASPAYVFEQNDTTKYYIKNNDEATGLYTGYLYATTTGIKWKTTDAAEAMADDNYAWYVKYDNKSRLYYIENVGTGKMISYNTGFKMTTRNTPSEAEKLHFMPARINTTIGTGRTALTKTAYWIMHPDRYNSQAIEANSTGVTAKTIDLSNNATRQQWLFLTESEIETVDEIAIKELTKELSTWLTNVRNTANIAHHSTSAELTTEDVDTKLENVLKMIENEAESYSSPTQANAAIESIKEALILFLSEATPDDAETPFEISYLIDNPTFDSSNSGWSDTPAWESKCCEYYTKNFDFNQTIPLKMPAGTYELKVQAFQRPGTLDDIANDFGVNGQDKVNAAIYAKTKQQKIKNICSDALEKSISSGSVKIDNIGYIPATMANAQAWFRKGYYENSVQVKTTSASNMKIGIKSSNNTNAGYWVIFDNFRLYFYGNMSDEDGTGLENIFSCEEEVPTYFDLSGRRVSTINKGIYIQNRKKMFVK